MKKIAMALMLALLLSGCGAEETLETVADDIPLQPVMAEPAEILREIEQKKTVKDLTFLPVCLSFHHPALVGFICRDTLRTMPISASWMDSAVPP